MQALTEIPPLTQTIKAPEHIEQVRFINWFRDNFHDCFIFAVPNGGKRGIMEAKRLKAEGVTSGVSDLIILRPNGKVLFLEMKTIKGKLSKEQIKFFDMLEVMGFDYIVGYGASDASKKILEKMKG